MYEDNITEDGIVLMDIPSKEENEIIDWDAVLRDFVRVQEPLPLSEEDFRELAFLQRLGVESKFATVP